MATKLKDLKVTKVDFVDQGANPDAYITLFKRKDDKDGGAGDTSAEDGKEKGNIWKRLFSAFAKAGGMKPEELDKAVEEIEKGNAVTFGEKMAERKNAKIADEIWDICYALQSSLCSILCDEEMDTGEASSAMQESLDDFYSMAKASLDEWTNGRTINFQKSEEAATEAELGVMKAARERLDEAISKADAAKTNIEPKGEEEIMTIDKSKMTEAERLILEDIEKRYGIAEAPAEPAPAAQQAAAADNGLQGNPVAKSDPAEPASAGGTEPTPAVPNGQEDIYKGLHPAVKAELDAFAKFRQEVEDREIREVAKKYTIIGKKEEELFPMLKSLKAAGGTAYQDMIAVLDSAVAAVEKSGVFSEIGKVGHGASTGAGAAESKIEGIAKSYMEKDPSLDYSTAVAKAWENNPDLMDEYDTEAGF